MMETIVEQVDEHGTTDDGGSSASQRDGGGEEEEDIKMQSFQDSISSKMLRDREPSSSSLMSLVPSLGREHNNFSKSHRSESSCTSGDCLAPTTTTHPPPPPNPPPSPRRCQQQQRQQQSRSANDGRVYVNVVETRKKTLAKVYPNDGQERQRQYSAKKTILHPMSVRFPHGYVTAIMGPSGSGKSTLLDLVTGCMSKSLCGNAQVNIRGSKSYIPQVDRLHGFYTCRSYMAHYARLTGLASKLDAASGAGAGAANSNSKTQAGLLIEQLLSSMGLANHMDTLVGDGVFLKGLSNGERKRLSIALEVLSNPENLFLDEPTSGLDSESAFQVMKFLRRYAQSGGGGGVPGGQGRRGGRRVVVTIHQPGSFLWHLVDHVVLLAKGKVMYQGPRSTMEEFFQWVGYPTPIHYNPADHYVTAVNDEFTLHEKNPNEWAVAFQDWMQHKDETWLNDGVDLNNDNEAYHDASSSRHGSTTFTNVMESGATGNAMSNVRNSSTSSSCRDDLALPTLQQEQQQQHGAGVSVMTFRGDGLEATLELTERYFANMLFNPGIFGTRVAMYVMLALVVGTLYWDVESLSTYASIQSRVSLLFYCAAFFVFMSIAAMPFTVMERGIVEKEVRNGYYHPAVYQVAQAVAATPGIFLLAFLTTLIIIGMTGMREPFWYFLNMFLALCCSEALAQLVSHTVPHFVIGMALVAATYGFFMLVQGFMKVPSEFPSWLRWTHSIAYHTYSWRTFMYSEFHGRTFPEAAFGFDTGEAVLKLYEIEHVDRGSDMLILVLYSLVLHLLSICVLHFKFYSVKIPFKGGGDRPERRWSRQLSQRTNSQHDEFT